MIKTVAYRKNCKERGRRGWKRSYEGGQVNTTFEPRAERQDDRTLKRTTEQFLLIMCAVYPNDIGANEALNQGGTVHIMRP